MTFLPCHLKMGSNQAKILRILCMMSFKEWSDPPPPNHVT